MFFNKLNNPKWIPKVWGGEEVWASNSSYAGKILHLKKGHFSSFHRHVKIEDWLVRGKVLLLHSFKPLLQKCSRVKGMTISVVGCGIEYVILPGVEYSENEKGMLDQEILVSGNCYHIPSLEWHLFYGLEDSEIFEVSTRDEESERLTESL